MKSSLVRFFILGAFCLGLPCVLPGQGNYYTQSQDITYGKDNTKKGKFFYVVEIKCENVQGKPFPSGSAEITACPTGVTVLRVAFTSEKIKLDDDYKIVLRPDCFGGTEHLKLIGNTGLTLKKKDSNDRPITGHFSYEVQKDGSGTLKIGYVVLKKNDEEGVTQPCVQFLSVPYTVSGMTDPWQEACDKAMQTFKVNKSSGIRQMQDLLRNNPAPPCFAEIDPILKDFAKYEQIALAAAAPMDCAKMKALAAQYPANGHFKSEVDALLKKCVAPPPPPKPGDPPDLIAWNQIKNSTDCRDFEQFRADFPDSQYAPEAMNRFRKCSNIVVQEERVSDLERRFALENVSRPRYKDLSLDYGLNIQADALLTSNQFTATLTEHGEYFVRIQDEMGKDTLLRINSAFSAAITALPDSSGYVVKINGDKPPYAISLEDLATGENIPLRESLKNAIDTALILFGELDARNLRGRYLVKVKGAQAPAPIEAGLLNGRPEEAGFMRILLVLLGLSAACGLLYLLYYFMVGRKKRRNKPIYTNYEQAN